MIRLVNDIDKEKTEIWSFDLFDSNIVLTDWSLYENTERIGNWNAFMEEKEEPIMSEDIKNRALSMVIPTLRVIQYKEFINKQL